MPNIQSSDTQEKYDLRKNATNFLHEALRNVRRAKRRDYNWPFAIIHLIQSLELYLKDLLRKEHPLLIFENVDSPKNTVSLTQALDRLILTQKVDIDDKEKVMINRASKYRNLIIHHEFDLNSRHFRGVFVQLFEFLHYFYHKHYGQDLHETIPQELWRPEAEVMTYFKDSMVMYHGTEMHKTTPSAIIKHQRLNAVLFEGKVYKRYRFGEEPDTQIYGKLHPASLCGDCSVKVGQFRIDACDTEICPICGDNSQLFGCEKLEAYIHIDD